MASRIARYNGKFYDLQTSNKTFLQVAKDLQTLGIQNFYFMLEIYDYSLVNVDPYQCDDKGKCTLSKDQITRILSECMRNPWYFLREIARIPDQGGSPVRYKANRGNIAQAWCITKGLDSWLCLPRQQGKTMSALSFESWMYLFGTSNSQFIFINKSGPDAKENLNRLRQLIELLPEYMQCESLVSLDGTVTKGVKNATKIANPVNNNSVIIKAQATSHDKALSLARGLTAPVLHFDEPEFTNHIKTIISNSVATYMTASANAKRNGAMYGRIFTCTPGDLDTQMGLEAQLILDRTAKWSEKMYDMKSEEEYKAYISSFGEMCNTILYIEYDYHQIGVSEETAQEIFKKTDDPLTFRREFLLQRLHGSSLSPFAQEDIEYIVQNQKKVIDELWLLEYYKFDIYEKLERHIPYLVGIDCSTGTSGDNNAITVINPYTVEPVAEFECSYIGETNYEKLIMELWKVIPRGVFIIERNSVGDGIIDHLIHTPMVNRLYYDKSLDLVESKVRDNETIESILKKNSTRKSYYGVYTSVQSREDMMAILARHVNEFKEKFVAANVIRDLSRLIRKSSGKIEAGSGFHDDSIMSYLIALYVYYHGNNLALFGIEKGARDEDLNNSGLKTDLYIDNRLDAELVKGVKEVIEKEQATEAVLNYNTIMAEAIRKSQLNTFNLTKSGFVDNTIFDNSVDTVLGEYDDEGSMDLSLFNDLNNF